MLRNSDSRYGAVAQLLHWTTVLLFAALIALGFYMHDLPLGMLKLEMYTYHKSLGVTLLVLLLLRLAWRLVNPVPPYPATMSAPERLAAHLSHFALYALVIAQPVIGILHSNATGFAVNVWWLFDLPAVISQDKELGGILSSAHYWTAIALLVLVALHAAAALRHHILLKDDVLTRMLPGKG